MKQGYIPPQTFQQTIPQVRTTARRSIPLLISAVLGLLFVVVLMSTAFNQTDQTLSTTANTAEDVGRQLGTLIGVGMLMPQIVTSAIAVILNAVGWGTRKRGLALAGAILYCVAAVLMIFNAPFLVPSIVLSFIGYARMK